MLELRATCPWCREPFEPARRDQVFCSKRCRQASHRFGKGCVARRPGNGQPLRLAYADPPYPGQARLYRDHRDFAGEVDHAELIGRLCSYDAWALSTSAAALPAIVELCVAEGLGDAIRVAAWVNGPIHTSSFFPLSSWEPVVYTRARPNLEPDRPPADSLVHGRCRRATDPGRVIGSKPADFIWWLFDLLAAGPSDTLDDLYPGSGGIARAWSIYTSGGPRRAPTTRLGDPRDASRRDLDRRAA